MDTPFPSMPQADLTGIFHQLRDVSDKQLTWPSILDQISVMIGATRLGFIGFPDTRIGACFSAPSRTRGHMPCRSASGHNSDLVVPQEVWTRACAAISRKVDHSRFDPTLVEWDGSHWLFGVLHAYSHRNIVLVCAEAAAGRRLSGAAQALAELVPHLRQASQTTLRLNLVRAQGMLEMLQQLRCGGLLIDYAGRSIAHNDETLRLAEGALALSNRSLVATDSGADVALRRMLAEANRGGTPDTGSTSGAVILPRSSQPSLIACVVLIQGASQGASAPIFHYARSILKLVNPEDHQHPTFLRDAFGLTPAETRLAIGLARGRSLQEFSSENNISVGTARVQLKSVFAKTSTRRQSELTALLARL